MDEEDLLFHAIDSRKGALMRVQQPCRDDVIACPQLQYNRDIFTTYVCSIIFNWLEMCMPLYRTLTLSLCVDKALNIMFKLLNHVQQLSHRWVARTHARHNLLCKRTGVECYGWWLSAKGEMMDDEAQHGDKTTKQQQLKTQKKKQNTRSSRTAVKMKNEAL